MSTEMNSYDAHHRCPKCDGPASTKYMPGGRYQVGYIERRCGRCGFRWDETTLDALPLQQQERT